MVGRSITLRIRMMDNEVWHFTSIYGVPDAEEPEKELEVQELKDYLLAKAEMHAANNEKAVFMGDLNSVLDPHRDKIFSSGWSRSGLVVQLALPHQNQSE